MTRRDCKPAIMRASRAEWDEWAVTVDDDGSTRPATRAELLNRGIAVADVGPDDVLYHCMVRNADRRDTLPGTVESEGGPRERHAALPMDAKLRLYGARVYRAPGLDLRAEATAAAGRALEARVPANGSRSAKPSDPPGALLVLEEARRRAADEDDPTRAAVVRMVDVEDSDVVEEDAIVVVRFAGERG